MATGHVPHAPAVGRCRPLPVGATPLPGAGATGPLAVPPGAPRCHPANSPRQDALPPSLLCRPYFFSRTAKLAGVLLGGRNLATRKSLTPPHRHTATIWGTLAFPCQTLPTGVTPPPSQFSSPHRPS